MPHNKLSYLERRKPNEDLITVRVILTLNCCPGLISGYLVAHYIFKNFPLKQGECYTMDSSFTPLPMLLGQLGAGCRNGVVPMVKFLNPDLFLSDRVFIPD